MCIRDSQEAMENGVLAGYPMVDVKVTLLDGAYHDVDSSELAFKIAGSMAFKDAANRAKPALLEPMMAVEVTTPEDFMGDVIGDLNSRRGQGPAMEERSGARDSKPLDMMQRRGPVPRDGEPAAELARAALAVALAVEDAKPQPLAAIGDRLRERERRSELLVARHYDGQRGFWSCVYRHWRRPGCHRPRRG